MISKMNYNKQSKELNSFKEEEVKVGLEEVLEMHLQEQEGLVLEDQVLGKRDLIKQVHIQEAKVLEM